MSNLVQTYRLHDVDPSAHGGAVRINRRDAAEWNRKGFGIFHTVQQFSGKRRLENLVHINAWAVDIDKGGKEGMLSRIRLGLIPTMVVETKNGFHAYWKAKDATRGCFRDILENRLVPFYQADKKAKDLARILRTPGFLHQKDPANPFEVKVVHYQHVEYSEREIFQFYRDTETPKKQKREHNKTKKAYPIVGDFWDTVWQMDCEYALTRLSGSQYVGCESYSFHENASGTRNIYVNGKSTSCWIDLDGRIGSLDEGGPTIAQWLNWFHKDYRKVVEIIQEVFPECKATSQLTLI